tara:strand:+ start:78 stop:689 length:612 start_codon:yes stop_codon:yes gene_type:complete
MTYTSSKVIELGSAAFRQPEADSHCKYIHGYQLKAELTFGCKELDKNNWVFDFGGLKDLKAIFNNQFDHTTVISAKDPKLDLFKTLQEEGIIQLRIMDNGVGIEKFAEWCFKTADTYIDEVTEGRVWVHNVTVYEHDNNYATINKTIVDNIREVEDTKIMVEVDQPLEGDSIENNFTGAARVGPNVKEGNFSDPFAGTSWGNS